MRPRVIIALLLFVVSSVSRGEAPAQFSKANQEFASGDFKAAIGDYEELVRAGQDSPNLFYNLGNAYFRQKDLGRSILNYERALALEPRHPEAQANLRIARDEARALELIPAPAERWFAFATMNQYAIAASIAFWIAAFALASLVFHRRRLTFAICVLSFFVFGFSVFAVYQLSHGKKGAALAVVTTDNVEARLATADAASRVLTLPAGSEIEVLSRRGDWIYAGLPNNLHGWMPASSAEQVRM